MKIFLAHNRYLIRGGEDESTDNEIRMLRAAGHEVSFFEADNERIATTPKWRVAMDTVWSRTAYARVSEILRDGRFDIAHFQNTFPLISPAAYYAARRLHIPVVQSLRNYRLLCPNAQLFRDNHVCSECVGRLFPWPGVVHRCYRGSLAGSATVASMLTVHRLLGTWQTGVDLYIALSNFARDKFVAAGLPARKIRVKPNFVHPDPGLGRHEGRFALFVGRLSEEKGLGTLMGAWDRLGATVPLRIIGTGPLHDRVVRWAQDRPAVQVLGARPLAETYAHMQEARLLILPSEWHEPFGRVAVEAFATGLPVVASRLGAMLELVADGQTGRHFSPGDAEDLAAKVAELWSSPEELERMGQAARSEYEQKYTADRNYELLMEIYEQAIRNAGERS